MPSSGNNPKKLFQKREKRRGNKRRNCRSRGEAKKEEAKPAAEAKKEEAKPAAEAKEGRS